LIDHDESVAPTNFTTNNFANVSLELPSDVAGAMGIVRLTFVPSNPIPPDGRLHLQMPDEYVLTQPVMQTGVRVRMDFSQLLSSLMALS